MEGNEEQYLIFLKYRRDFLSKMTGYSKGHLSRIATGAKSPSAVFIGVCCHTLKESQEDLFRLVKPDEVRIGPADGLAARLTKAEAEIEKLKA